MKAIILAAGKGTRLAPITDNRPKHILEIAGKSIICRILEKIIDVDFIEEILIVTHHYEDLIKQHVSSNYPQLRNGKIKFVRQSEPNGTGGAVKDALTKNPTSTSFMVIYGDLILGNGIDEVLEIHKDNPELGAILGASVENPENYGLLVIDGEDVTGIREKQSDAPKGSLINAGVYLFPKFAASRLNDLKLSERNEYELTDLIHLTQKDGIQYRLCRLDDGWFDIGRPWELLNANQFLLPNEVSKFEVLGKVEENVNIRGNVHLAKTAKLLSGTYIEGDVYIDEGAVIGPNCYIRGNTYLGKNVRIGNACEVKNSIIYQETHIAHLSYVGDSIIGEKCNFGAGTITANLRHDNGNIKVNVKGQRIQSNRRKLGVIMGDNVKTGIGVNILPGVKINSDKRINAGDLVDRDL